MNYYQELTMTRAVCVVSLVVLTLSLTFAQPLLAQAGVGPYLGVPVGEASAFSGISVRFDTDPFQIAPSFEASFTDGFSSWQLNGDVHFRPGLREALFTPYVGAGLNVHHSPGADARLGANLIGGMALNLGSVVPFIQLRAVVAGNTNVAVLGGLVVTPPFRGR